MHALGAANWYACSSGDPPAAATDGWQKQPAAEKDARAAQQPLEGGSVHANSNACIDERHAAGGIAAHATAAAASTELASSSPHSRSCTSADDEAAAAAEEDESLGGADDTSSVSHPLALNGATPAVTRVQPLTSGAPAAHPPPPATVTTKPAGAPAAAPGPAATSHSVATGAPPPVVDAAS